MSSRPQDEDYAPVKEGVNQRMTQGQAGIRGQTPRPANILRERISPMTYDELIQKAASLIKAKKIGSFTVADVGCALITDHGNVYTGVCIDTSSGMGFCAEHTAIGSMVTGGEYRIKAIVAVWKDENEVVYILAPCGRCREFIYKTNKENLDTDVILGRDKVVKLKELLPYYDWFQRV
jgi:cytidine deaminase